MEKIFGKSFWPMIGRFALIPILLSILSLPFWLFLGPDQTDIELSKFDYVWITVFHILFWTWIGWGLAFWRFERDQIPVKSFLIYPLISGLSIIPIYWILMEAGLDPDRDEFVAATIFGALAGPLMAILIASFWRYALNMTSLRKPL